MLDNTNFEPKKKKVMNNKTYKDAINEGLFKPVIENVEMDNQNIHHRHIEAIILCFILLLYHGNYLRNIKY